MSTDLFDYEDYKAYLKAQIANNSSRTGYKAALARSLDVPQALISQVLHGKTHFSLDHAFKVSFYWHLNEEETDQWLDLVSLARASSSELKKHLKTRLNERKRKREDISARLSQPRIGGNEEEWQYYTQWLLQAIHMVLTIPMYQSSKSISQAFHLPQEYTLSLLKNLEGMGLVGCDKKTGNYQTTKKRIHLPKTSHVSPINHWLWRQKAMEHVYKPKETDLFYSTLHTLSEDDTRRLRSLLMEAIENASSIVAPSEEQTLVGLNIDFFKLV